MITLIERGIADFITAQITAAVLAFPVAAKACTSKAPLPGDRPTIIAQCTDLPNDVAGSAEWTAALAIYVATDASVKDNTDDRHAALELLLTDMFAAPSAAAINSAVSAKLTGYTAASFARLGWRPGRHETTWAPFLSISLQVTKS